MVGMELSGAARLATGKAGGRRLKGGAEVVGAVRLHRTRWGLLGEDRGKGAPGGIPAGVTILSSRLKPSSIPRRLSTPAPTQPGQNNKASSLQSSWDLGPGSPRSPSPSCILWSPASGDLLTSPGGGLGPPRRMEMGHLVSPSCSPKVLGCP